MPPNRPPQQHNMLQSNQTPSPIQMTPEGIAAKQRLKKMERPLRIAFWSMMITCALRFAMLAMAIEGFVYLLAVMASGISLIVAPALECRRMLFKHKTRGIRNQCRKCDYDLTGLYNGDRCPECGTKIDRPHASNLP